MSGDNNQVLVDERSVGQPNDLSQQTQQKKEEICLETLRGLPIGRTKEVFKEIIDEKTPEEQKELLSAITPPIGPPSSGIRDYLWLIVVIAFALVLVGSFFTLALGVFYKEKTSPELILTMFTSVVGFLAGLFVPSPIANRGQDNID